MGCRLVKTSQYENYKILEDNKFQSYVEKLKQANKRMEQIEKIFEVLTNDGRLKDIINQIEKNHCDSNSDVLQQQKNEHKPDTCEN